MEAPKDEYEPRRKLETMHAKQTSPPVKKKRPRNPKETRERKNIREEVYMKTPIPSTRPVVCISIVRHLLYWYLFPEIDGDHPIISVVPNVLQEVNMLLA